MLPVASCLMRGVQDLLSAEKLVGLDGNMMRIIAGDSEETVRQREVYRDRIAGLENAKTVMQRCALRIPGHQAGKSMWSSGTI